MEAQVLESIREPRFRAFVYSGFSYENNVFELDADLVEDRFAAEHL